MFPAFSRKQQSDCAGTASPTLLAQGFPICFRCCQGIPKGGTPCGREGQMMAGGLVVTAGASAIVLLMLMRWLMTSKKRTVIRDKVVLITGASSGLGEALAHLFYQRGAKIILCARRVSELERVKQDLLNNKEENPHEPRIVQLDLANYESVIAKAEEALGFYGNIDILVNNAGISYRGETMETKLEVDQRLMLVNFFGQVALTKAILPSMVQRGGGHVVGVSSMQGKLAIPFRSAYAASKHAFQAFLDSLRAETADQGINVLVVSPAYIQTNLSLNAVTGSGEKYGVMDSTTAGGMSPQYVARRIVHAVETHQSDVILAPFTHKLAIYIRTICPSLYFWLMMKRAKKQRAEMKKAS